MEIRLGELLVRHGVLTPEQVRTVLDIQQRTGEPFGLICEHVLGVPGEAVEQAWAVQYEALTRTIDPATEPFDDGTKQIITRRQAWQFRILPVRFEGRELMMITTPRHLRRALRFATRVIGVPVYFVLASPEDLGAVLCRRYPLAGMTAASVMDGGIDRLLEICRDDAPPQRASA